MTRVKLKPTEHEIVVALGRRVGQRRKILVIAVYLPPSYDAENTEACLNEVNDTILEMRKHYNNPFVIVAGDFNRRDATRATRDFPDNKQIRTPPTRGQAVLDIILTSFNNQIVNSGTAAPIECVEGTPSGHLTVYAKFRMPRVGSYAIQDYTYLHVTDKGKEAFSNAVVKQEWGVSFKLLIRTPRSLSLNALWR